MNIDSDVFFGDQAETGIEALPDHHSGVAVKREEPFQKPEKQR